MVPRGSKQDTTLKSEKQYDNLGIQAVQLECRFNVKLLLLVICNVVVVVGGKMPASQDPPADYLRLPATTCAENTCRDN